MSRCFVKFMMPLMEQVIPKHLTPSENAERVIDAFERDLLLPDDSLNNKNNFFPDARRLGKGLSPFKKVSQPSLNSYPLDNMNKISKSQFYRYFLPILEDVIEKRTTESLQLNNLMHLLLCNECKEWNDNTQLSSSEFIATLARDFACFVLNENYTHGVQNRNRIGTFYGDNKKVGVGISDKDLERQANNAEGFLRHIEQQKPEP